MESIPESKPKLSLRERKKKKTRSTIQEQAFLLFQMQGYYNTTIEQIAEASEISQSTFFRYFPTKESVVLEDDYDPLIIESFLAQPAELSPLQALRQALRTGLDQITEEEKEIVSKRVALIMSVPELRAVALNQYFSTMHMFAEILAKRTGRSKDDLDVLSLAGSVIGVMMSVQTYCEIHSEANFLHVLDEAINRMDQGVDWR